MAGDNTRKAKAIGLMAKSLMCIATAIAMLAASSQAIAQTTVEPRQANPATEAAWRAIADTDLTFLTATIKRNYIYANYNAGPAWDELSAHALAQGRREVANVRDFGSYRAVIMHYLASFQDPHLSAYFQVSALGGRWPGFTLKYSGDRYVVDRSRVATIAIGNEVESCDGRALVQWIDELSPYYGGPRGRESTRATVAQQFLIDSGNPLYSLPRVCRIAGKDVTLNWRGIPDGIDLAIPTRSGESPSTLRDGALTVGDFGNNGAWVRIGTMIPSNQAEASAFQALIEHAPTLRGKDTIILDVRGNRGGNYNWFMAFLRALYGQSYADYYARARLEIAPAMMTPPGETFSTNIGFPPETQAIKLPDDPPLTMTGQKTGTLPSGAQLLQFAAPVQAITYPAKAPTSATSARVYVLADFGCASACLSFIDEMMRFPGVTLVGSETHIDRRAGGFPVGYPAPSGLVVVRMGRMVRDGRARGENEAWAPAPQYRYPGDIADTDGIKSWLLGTVIPQDMSAGMKWRQLGVLKGPVNSP